MYVYVGIQWVYTNTGCFLSCLVWPEIKAPLGFMCNFPTESLWFLPGLQTTIRHFKVRICLNSNHCTVFNACKRIFNNFFCISVGCMGS
eukprot:NODE_844_length_584_cov_271.505470_g834_i0.p2 GENE.NODE_844_length_584_cov_271.505470_g834_i0~~NODE_844_length_584_cov_271.505470_g834_i0.p2  ORF type:complete len:89 (-),score=5.03 NODE_844_length_584_cov_271.505470_g834_i0:98-364(-)